MLVLIRTDHPQYHEIMRDVWSRFPGGPKREFVAPFPDEIAALQAHMQTHQMTRTGWVANQKES